MKYWFGKLKVFIEDKFKQVVKWIDYRIDKYMMNNNYILYFLYLFIIIYFIYFCFYFKMENIILIWLLLFLIYFIKYVKSIVLVIDNKNERLIMFNILFIIINFLTIFFNVLRNLFQYHIRYFKNYFYIIIEYVFNLDLNEYKILNLFVNNMMALVSLQVCYILLSLYFFYNIWNYFFDFDKEDMKDTDNNFCWIIKYDNFYKNLINFWVICGICNVFIHFLFAIKVPLIMDFLFFGSLSLILIFNINALFVISKYYLRKK